LKEGRIEECCLHQALPGVSLRPFLYGALVAFSALLVYDAVTDVDGHLHVLESRPTIDRGALGRFVTQIEDNLWWDPGQDPEEFKKFVRVCIAIFGIGIVGAVLGMSKGEVDGLAQGRAPKDDPDSVIAKLQRFIRRVSK
jgi:hypothetical protein